MSKKTNNPVPIYVSARILRHISRGIYRTPAGALKELISNAYDAAARKVTINTGFPAFEKITVTDNGNGMAKNDFIDIIQNIGLSDKVAGMKFKIPGSKSTRTTIGHYGIGMLAVGQLCSRAKITSKLAGSTEGFEATINFDQFEKTIDEGVERSLITDETDIEKKDKKLKDYKASEEKKLSVGQCAIKDLGYSEEDKKEHFTRIKLEGTRGWAQRKLSGNLLKEYKGLKILQKHSAKFDDLVKLFREYEKHIKLGQYPYEKLLWELATYSPIKYPDLEIFKTSLAYFKRLTDAHDFEVVIDGMKMHKPFDNFFFKDKEYPVRKIFTWKNNNYTKDKKVSGYLIYRQRIRPKSMQGILVREVGVAVGMYDLTFLEYPYHEAAKFEQLSGELFIEGLSGALNIDRNSFNEIDDNYLALVKWFHDKLHAEVFPKIKRIQKSRREDASKVFAQLSNRYFKSLNKEYKISFRDFGKNKELFKRDGENLYINKKHPQGKPKKSAIGKLFLASLLVISGMIAAEKMEKTLCAISEAMEG